MIHVKAVVKGEPDVPLITRFFEYSTNDEELFFSSASKIHEKLQRKLKINANEALLVYCSYIVNSIRAGQSSLEIKENAPKVLSEKDVMIGVPETLRNITFSAKIDQRATRRIELDRPIPTSSYALT
ncbi:MAG: urease subunit gamma [Nitrososphaera sp.]|nr:urease subunit gamma [Nitrososphaera sp.]